MCLVWSDGVRPPWWSPSPARVLPGAGGSRRGEAVAPHPDSRGAAAPWNLGREGHSRSDMWGRERGRAHGRVRACHLRVGAATKSTKVSHGEARVCVSGSASGLLTRAFTRLLPCSSPFCAFLFITSPKALSLSSTSCKCFHILGVRTLMGRSRSHCAPGALFLH